MKLESHIASSTTSESLGSPEPPFRVDRHGVVHTLTVFASGRGPRSGRIVVGVDGSPSSLDALRRGIRMVASLGGSLEAVCAWQEPGGYVDFLVDWKPGHLASLALDSAVDAVLEGSRPEWFSQSLQWGSAPAVLIEQSRGADLLIVGSRGHGRLAGLLLGSVSTACAAHAHCPVLVMHDIEPAAPPMGFVGGVRSIA